MVLESGVATPYNMLGPLIGKPSRANHWLGSEQPGGPLRAPLCFFVCLACFTCIIYNTRYYTHQKRKIDSAACSAHTKTSRQGRVPRRHSLAGPYIQVHTRKPPPQVASPAGVGRFFSFLGGLPPWPRLFTAWSRRRLQGLSLVAALRSVRWPVWMDGL